MDSMELGARLPSAGLALALLGLAPGHAAHTSLPSRELGRPPLITLERRLAIFGTSIGAAGFWAGDLDRDGTRTREIVAAAGSRPFERNEFWYVAGRTGLGYAQDWVSPWYMYGVASLAVSNVDTDPAREIIVGTHRRIEIWDGAKKAQQQSWTLSTLSPRSIVRADLDGDGDPDVVFCDGSRGVMSLDLHSGVERLVRAGVGCFGLAAGDVDGDRAVEIVVGQLADSGLVIDTATAEVEWTHPGGFGIQVRLGDLDGAPGLEIVASKSSMVQAFSGVERRRIRAFTTRGWVSALAVADPDRDGSNEILFWDSSTRHLQAYDPRTESITWSEPQPQIAGLAIADVDGDGAHELVLGTGADSTVAEQLRILDSVTRSVEWESRDLRGPFWGLSFGDLHGDGGVQVVHSTYSSQGSEGQGRYVVHDLRMGTAEVLGALREGPYWIPMWDLATADVDGDPPLEILTATGRFGAGVLTCYDGRTGKEQWRASVDEGLSIQSIAVADLDGDGTVEVVAGTRREAPTSFQQVQVYVFDAFSGALEWRSPDLGNSLSLSLLLLAQLDDDAGLEVVVGARFTGEVFVFDGVTRELTELGVQDATALAVRPRSRDGRSDLLIGTAGGEIRVVDPSSGVTTRIVGRVSGAVAALVVRDINADGVADYVLSDSQRLHVQDGRRGSLIWSSEVLGLAAGASGSLIVGDVDADGHLEIVVSCDNHGLAVFEVRPRWTR
jgi:VCBS repeat protein